MLLASALMKNQRSVVSVRRRSLLGLALLVVFAGATHALLVSCGGGSKPASNTEQSTPSTATTPTPAAGESSTSAASNAAASGGGAGGPLAGADVAAGEKIYKLRCTPCHGPQGKGDGPLGKSLNPKPRDHTDAAYMKSRTDQQLVDVVTNGKGAMPAWGKSGTLSPTDVRNVVAYVRTLAK
jgi:mono/diheme cytochrome c family protein